MNRPAVRVAWAMLILSTVWAPLGAEGWKAGVASVSITPDKPVHLLGYQTRTKPFASVDADIFAKALAIEDDHGNRGVIVTSDLVGLQDAFSGEICQRIKQKTGIQRRQLILNASHNHTGPLLSLNPMASGNLAHGNMTEADVQRTIEYSRQLQGKIVALVEAALADLQPAELAWGEDAVRFVMNRRSGEPGSIYMSANPHGQTDPIVPVLRVTGPAGKVRCILFGCACHNTTLTPDHNVISGDYAGYAQEFLQQRFPGAQAMFISGCGADANPEPRGNADQAKAHGRELAESVRRVMEGQMRPLDGRLHMAYELVDLPLLKLSKDDLAKYMVRGDAQAMMAAHLMHILEGGGSLKEKYTAPVALWRFGNQLTLVALPGEGVSGYADLVKRRLKSRNVWVSSYNNDCFGYLPTAQIVREGGHEAIGVTVWLWGNHLTFDAGFFSEDVESTILDAVAALATR
jgi:hypothetical protein